MKSLIIPLLICIGYVIEAQTVDQNLLHGIVPRSIGPAGMSGRITDIDVPLSDPDTWYIATASGGLWKTINAGVTFNPLFDAQSTQSIGAVGVSQSNPQVIYVGTGEGNPRNTVSSGNGVYKSFNGGKSWVHLGLSESKNIHRIIIHPDNPDVVYVGATGPPFGTTTERGLFKTTDGGTNWNKILFTNDQSGIADLVMDPRNPNKLFAAMWEHIRTPWSFSSGGEGSGLFLSFDSGDSWESLNESHGLPPKPWGRIGVAIAPGNNEVVYALIESKKNALYRSDDGGSSWKKINEETIGSRPFYFADLRVDPVNENLIYNLYSRLSRSEDGGKKFEVIEDWGRKVHADHHAMWIHPKDPDFILLGTDGGLYWSRDKARTWDFADNLPLAQFYHATVDEEIPYNVYGGLQDNGTWYGPAYTWHRAGLRNSYWNELAFNDGFDVVMEKSDPNVAYALWQGGMLVRVNKSTGQRKTIKPVSKDERLRFNWNTPIASDPFRANMIYIGSQYVHRSSDRGESWSKISPDLTTNDRDKQNQETSGGLTIDATDAENYTTLSVIAPSPLQQGMIWSGSDDGQVYVTMDDGETWKKVTPKVPDLPMNSWVTQIKPSNHDHKSAFIVLDNHRRNDYSPYIYLTNDLGKHWKPVKGTESLQGYALSFLQDHEVPQLMFAGTDQGLYYTMDGGSIWKKWQNGLPSVPVSDLVVHPKEQDLVIATFGRSFFVLDDLRALRALIKNPTLQSDSLAILSIPDATLGIIKQARGQRLSPDGLYAGENRPYGAMISFWVGQSTQSDAILNIYTKDQLIWSDSLSVSGGLNRISWNLQADGHSIFGPLMDPNLEKPWVPPGQYTAQIVLGNVKKSYAFTVLPPPGITYESAVVEEAVGFRQRLEKIWASKDSLVMALKVRHTESGDNEELRRQYRDLLDRIMPQIDQGVVSNSARVGSEIDNAFYYSHSPYESTSVNDNQLIEKLESKWQSVRKKILDELAEIE